MLDGGEVDDDAVDVAGQEGHEESHCDQVDGNHLPGFLQNLCVEIKTLALRLRLLIIYTRNSVKHVGIHRLTLHLERVLKREVSRYFLFGSFTTSEFLNLRPFIRPSVRQV